MSAHLELACDNCGTHVRANLDEGYAFAKTTLRVHAKERYGWVRRTVEKKKVDLCSTCKDVVGR